MDFTNAVRVTSKAKCYKKCLLREFEDAVGVAIDFVVAKIEEAAKDMEARKDSIDINNASLLVCEK